MEEKKMEAKKGWDFLDDPAFGEKIMACESTEAVQALFKEQGVELTLEDVEAMGKLIQESVAQQYGEGELSDEDMAQVAGGDIKTWFVKTVGKKLGELVIKDGYKHVVKPCINYLKNNPRLMPPNVNPFLPR